MAGEEEVELRDLVAQSLEANGVLGKIRVSLSRPLTSQNPLYLFSPGLES